MRAALAFVLATSVAWPQEGPPPPPVQAGAASQAAPPSAPVPDAASDRKEESVDPFEGLGELADKAEQQWQKVAGEELPRIDQTCVATRVHTGVKKVVDARAKYDAANRNYLEAMGRYTKDSISHLRKPAAEDAPRLNGLTEDLKRAQTQIQAKKKELADAVEAGDVKDSYRKSLEELIKQTEEEAANLTESIRAIESAGRQRENQLKEWTALGDLAEQRVRTAESMAQRFAAYYEELGESRLAKCIYLIDQNRVRRQAAEADRQLGPSGQVK